MKQTLLHIQKNCVTDMLDENLFKLKDNVGTVHYTRGTNKNETFHKHVRLPFIGIHLINDVTIGNSCGIQLAYFYLLNIIATRNHRQSLLFDTHSLYNLKLAGFPNSLYILNDLLLDAEKIIHPQITRVDGNFILESCVNSELLEIDESCGISTEIKAPSNLESMFEYLIDMDDLTSNHDEDDIQESIKKPQKQNGVENHIAKMKSPAVNDVTWLKNNNFRIPDLSSMSNNQQQESSQVDHCLLNGEYFDGQLNLPWMQHNPLPQAQSFYNAPNQSAFMFNNDSNHSSYSAKRFNLIDGDIMQSNTEPKKRGPYACKFCKHLIDPKGLKTHIRVNKSRLCMWKPLVENVPLAESDEHISWKTNRGN